MDSNGATEVSKQQKVEIIYKRPYVYEDKVQKYIKQVCTILDKNRKWRDAALIMGYTNEDINDFNITSLKDENPSPTKVLISNWGDQNHTVTELFMVLYRLEQYWAMDCLKTTVEEKYHILIKDFKPEIDEDPLRRKFDALPTISYKELLKATDNWNDDNVLGKGGFGKVFKGRWKNFDVAIKRFECKSASEEERFNVDMKQQLAELQVLISARQDNILPLYAYSSVNELCVVYQLMAGGSLDRRIHGGTPLTLQQRLNIANGTACGIQFLHTFREKPFIHCDIKPANILLDVNLVPKIGDFGLVREGSLEAIEVSMACGTRPYLPDEFLYNRKLSTKVDTFSYGVVLFEMVTGLRPYDRRRTGKMALLSNYIRSEYSNKSPYDILHLMDKKLGSTEIAKQFYLKFIELGLWCVNEEMESRPEMTQVFEKLDNYKSANKHKLMESERKNVVDESFPKILYKELVDATNRWDDQLIFGKGAFGALFKGRWKNTDVAIKRINFHGVPINENVFKNEMNQTINELKFLASCRHDNILLLLGYSNDGIDTCLVYHYMAGGSLQWRLYLAKNQYLSFEKRKEITIGTARGLQFLHTFQKSKPFIHGNIKPGNIFLDANCVPKIGDFGLVREGSHEAMKVSRMYGYQPYMPDEFLYNNIFSIKVDTFSFGVVLLEMMTGLKAFDEKRIQSQAFLSSYIRSQCTNTPESIQRFIDKKLEITENERELCVKFVILGMHCTIQDFNRRPEMVQVFNCIEAL